MRDRQKTIAALRRLAERPGTPQEGETARRKLRELEAQMPGPAAAAKSTAGWIPSVNYVQYEREIDINLLKEILDVKMAARPAKKPTVTWEDMEGVIRRNIYRRGQGDAD